MCQEWIWNSINSRMAKNCVSFIRFRFQHLKRRKMFGKTQSMIFSFWWRMWNHHVDERTLPLIPYFSISSYRSTSFFPPIAITSQHIRTNVASHIAQPRLYPQHILSVRFFATNTSQNSQWNTSTNQLTNQPTDQPRKQSNRLWYMWYHNRSMIFGDRLAVKN